MSDYTINTPQAPDRVNRALSSVWRRRLSAVGAWLGVLVIIGSVSVLLIVPQSGGRQVPAPAPSGLSLVEQLPGAVADAQAVALIVAMADQVVAHADDQTTGTYLYRQFEVWTVEAEFSFGQESYVVRGSRRHLWRAADRSGRYVEASYQARRAMSTTLVKTSATTLATSVGETVTDLESEPREAEPVKAEVGQLQNVLRQQSALSAWQQVEAISHHAGRWYLDLQARRVLLRALSTVPGTVVQANATDHAGRAGMAVSVGADCMRRTLLIDRTTGVILDSTLVNTCPGWRDTWQIQLYYRTALVDGFDSRIV